MGILSRGRGLIWLQSLLLFICTAYVSHVTSQNGFLSIDCGSNASSYDNSTGIHWVTDATYTSTGNNIDNITVQTYDPVLNPILNKRQVGSMRYFNNTRSRDCYVLPVEINETYLVRATFFYGSLGNASSPISFNVYMDNTNVGSLEWKIGENLDASYWYEMIYSAPSSSLNFCLVRKNGPSFISTLELRKLATGMYADAVGPTQGKYLSMWDRVNLGPPDSGPVAQWRYPDDIYDRIWGLFGPNDNATHISNRNIRGSSNSFSEDPDRPPLIVMQDAWVFYHQNILWVMYNIGSPFGPAYIAAYFQEVDGNASATNVRGMDYYLNNKRIASFNSSDRPLEIHNNANIQELAINISFVQADWSRLSPILNAYEIHSIYPYNTSTTNDEDVSALSAFQSRLNLTDWNGDPCLPIPFDWLTCSDDLSPRITNLSLANQGYGGSIPREILNLTALTYLIFNNNSFSGSIPDFSNLVHLQVIYLQNNHLSGAIPSFLGRAFPNLTQLNLDNNNLDGTLPSDLIKPGLNFTALNNPSINCTVPACGAAAPPPSTSGSKSDNHAILIYPISVGGIVLLIIVSSISGIAIWKLRRRVLQLQKFQEELTNKRVSPVIFSYSEIKVATSNFHEDYKIGSGGFGVVYKGALKDGTRVAVKKLFHQKQKQVMKDFLNEVVVVTGIKHKNLIQLKGCCIKGHERMLVYDYAENGNLEQTLYAKGMTTSPLDLKTKANICFDIAGGLLYLHNGLQPKVIHRDIKPANILLDHNYTAKVADFGLARRIDEELDHPDITRPAGTRGYQAPELELTDKMDVFSFGILVLEIMSGRKSIDTDQATDAIDLRVWAHELNKSNNLINLLPDYSSNSFDKNSITNFIKIAVECTTLDPRKRPSMLEALIKMGSVLPPNRSGLMRTDSESSTLQWSSSAILNVDGESSFTDLYHSRVKESSLLGGETMMETLQSSQGFPPVSFVKSELRNTY